MTPDYSIQDVVAHLRHAARRCHVATFDFRMQWLWQEIIATVDAGKSDPVLRFDIARLMGTRDFDMGWRHHRDFAAVPCWPEIRHWHN